MRKNLAGIGVLICFAFMLLFPKDLIDFLYHIRYDNDEHKQL